MALSSKSGESVANVDGVSTANSVDNLAEFEAVELTCRANRVCAHVIEAQPIAYLKSTRQGSFWADTVNRVASWSPDTT